MAVQPDLLRTLVWNPEDRVSHNKAHMVLIEPGYEKPAFCICKNIGWDQLCGIHTIDH